MNKIILRFGCRKHDPDDDLCNLHNGFCASHRNPDYCARSLCCLARQ